MHDTNASKWSCLATILPIILDEKSEVKEVKEISANYVSEIQMFIKHSLILFSPFLSFQTLQIVNELMF